MPTVIIVIVAVAMIELYRLTETCPVGICLYLRVLHYTRSLDKTLSSPFRHQFLPSSSSTYLEMLMLILTLPLLPLPLTECDAID